MKVILILMMAAATAISMPLMAQQQQGNKSATAKRTLSRSEWLAKVGECALNPEALKDTMSQLSSEDKTAFLAEVNAAIEKMPGSTEEKAAQFLAANRAAVAGAGASDRAAVLAEVFATVPPESLTVINEEFAKNEFARPASMSDEGFVAVMSSAMDKIAQRCASAESGAVRTGFAGLMFVRAAGSAEQAARDAAIAAVPAESRQEAANTWFPGALGEGQAASYDSMLASSQAGEEPDHPLVVSIVSQQLTDSMLADLQTEKGLPADYSGDVDRLGVKTVAEVPHDAAINPAIPLSLNTGNPADVNKPAENPYHTEDHGNKEPVPYWMQNP